MAKLDELNLGNYVIYESCCAEFRGKITGINYWEGIVIVKKDADGSFEKCDPQYLTKLANQI